MTDKKSRTYCFTYFNDDTEAAWRVIQPVMKEADYGIVGKEVCPSTGRTHYQCYIRYKSPRAFGPLQKKLVNAHIEVANGTDEDNRKYCSKEGEFVEFGTISKQGKRTDLDEVKKLVKEGAPMKYIWENVTSFQALKFADCGKKYFEPKRNWKPEVVWYYGPSGAGKSMRASEEGGEDAYWHTGNLDKWWEGYDGEEIVIVDDFRGAKCTFSKLLNIIDRYPVRVETKGSSRQLLAKKFIFTSIKHPRELYDKEDEDLKQLMRRIDSVVLIGGTHSESREASIDSDPLDRKSGVILDPDTTAFGSEDLEEKLMNLAFEI